MSAKKKLIVLVLEGVGNNLLLPWCQRGLLPNLAQLLAKQGGRLDTHLVPYEASALQTAFTGYAPEEHGVFSYWKVHNPGYVPQIWNSTELLKPYLWQWEELSDLKFGVVNIFGTYPAYALNGKMIAYLFKQTLRSSYPADLLHQMAMKGLRYGHDVSAFYNGQPRATFLDTVLRIDKMRCEVALEILPEVDVLLTNFTVVDRVSHFYWQELEDGSPYAPTETAIFQAYQAMDQIVGKFMERLDDESHLLVFSDLAFGPLREFVSVNNYLERGGFLRRDAMGKVDFKNTTAFEAVQGSHGININTVDRYELGSVARADHEKVRAEVRAYLADLINPKTGLKMFRQVCPAGELYPGSAVNLAPDLILDPLDKRYQPMGDQFWAEHVHRDYQSGWHRNDCFWTGMGPFLSTGKRDGSLLDITPTILHLLGCNIPRHCQGTPLGK